MKKFKALLIVLLIITPFLFLDASGSSASLTNPIGYNSLEELVSALISFVRMIAIALAPLLFIIAAFYYLTAGADPENVTKAKKIITWTIIGLAIVLIAEGISILVKNVLTIT